jgi:hypothetical protein
MTASSFNERRGLLIFEWFRINILVTPTSNNQPAPAGGRKAPHREVVAS